MTFGDFAKIAWVVFKLIFLVALILGAIGGDDTATRIVCAVFAATMLVVDRLNVIVSRLDAARTPPIP
jgi:uncharacterized PurR-regulated membrane protein YhhQ (DUF165 family)